MQLSTIDKSTLKKGTAATLTQQHEINNVRQRVDELLRLWTKIRKRDHRV